MALKTVEIFLDAHDLGRVRQELLAHMRNFGHTPAPHLQEEANADMDRILTNIITCLQLRGTVATGEGNASEEDEKG